MSNEAKKIGKNAALALLSQVPVVSAFSKFFEDLLTRVHLLKNTFR